MILGQSRYQMIELTSPEFSPCHNTTTPPLSTFPTISEPLDYDEFFREYLEKNQPCVLSERLTEDWRARREWVTQAGAPDVDYLLHHFGKLPCLQITSGRGLNYACGSSPMLRSLSSVLFYIFTRML